MKFLNPIAEVIFGYGIFVSVKVNFQLKRFCIFGERKLLFMLTKKYILNSFENLPENLTIDQVIDHVIFIEKVQKGLADAESGKVFTKDQAKEKLGKWLK